MKSVHISKTHTVSLYGVPKHRGVSEYLASTPHTRAICSDPFVYGVEYTRLLQYACSDVLQSLETASLNSVWEQGNTVVFHILRGGLNFGLRDALHSAYGWNYHRSAFISSQRARDEKGDWYITENRYQKISLPDHAHIIFGDVVATGVSLEHALFRIIEVAEKDRKQITGFTFFTIGSPRAGEILERIDQECKKRFSSYMGSRIIYFEGIFGVGDEHSTLHIMLPGTDLLHSPALLTDEFISYQQQALPYALERCTIYDAGSRACDVHEYLEDVRGYWEQVLELAYNGMTLSAYLQERFSEDPRLNDSAWVQEHTSTKLLAEVANVQIAKTRLLDLSSAKSL